MSDMNDFNLRKTKIRLALITDNLIRREMPRSLYRKGTSFPAVLDEIVGKVFEILPDNRHYKNYGRILKVVEEIYGRPFSMQDCHTGKKLCLPNGEWLLNGYYNSDFRSYCLSVKPNVCSEEGFIKLPYFGWYYEGVDAAALAALDVLLPDIVRCAGKVVKGIEIDRAGKLAILNDYVGMYPLKTKFYFDNRGGASIKFAVSCRKSILVHFAHSEIGRLPHHGAPAPEELTGKASRNGKYRIMNRF